MFAVFCFGSIDLQQTLGFRPVQTGLAFLPLTAGIIAFSGVPQQIGGALGLAILSTVAATQTSNALESAGPRRRADEPGGCLRHPPS